MELNKIILGDNIEALKKFPDNFFDACITDSPYGLGKEPNAEACIMDWVTKGYHEVKGTGFMGKKWDAFVPQPLLWKEVYRVLKPGGYCLSFFGTRTYDWGTLAIRLAGFEIRDCIQWIYGNGFPKSKSCLKPANEPICVARKPGLLSDLNVDESRIDNGRWPSNVMLDEEAAAVLDEQSGVLKSGARNGIKSARSSFNGGTFVENARDTGKNFLSSEGGASRFFYVAKASPSERAGRKHPTIKPIKLMEQLIKPYCPVGGVVLDPHFGSGTSGAAGYNTGRNWVGVDNDEVSVNEANNFLKKHLAKKENLLFV